MAKKLLVGLALLACFTGLIFVINAGLVKKEKAECERWQTMAKTYPGFYLTDAERAQCEVVAPETLK